MRGATGLVVGIAVIFAATPASGAVLGCPRRPLTVGALSPSLALALATDVQSSSNMSMPSLSLATALVLVGLVQSNAGPPLWNNTRCPSFGELRAPHVAELFNTSRDIPGFYYELALHDVTQYPLCPAAPRCISSNKTLLRHPDGSVRSPATPRTPTDPPPPALRERQILVSRWPCRHIATLCVAIGFARPSSHFRRLRTWAQI